MPLVGCYITYIHKTKTAVRWGQKYAKECMLPFESSHFETLQEFGCFNYHKQKPWSCGECSESVPTKFWA